MPKDPIKFVYESSPTRFIEFVVPLVRTPKGTLLKGMVRIDHPIRIEHICLLPIHERKHGEEESSFEIMEHDYNPSRRFGKKDYCLARGEFWGSGSWNAPHLIGKCFLIFSLRTIQPIEAVRVRGVFV